jgi:hypothetical protein
MLYNIPRRPVPKPIYVPMPRYGDSDALSMTQTNTANINAGIRANYEFANQRTGNEKYGIILRWDMGRDPEIPLYNIALHELGLSRHAFEEICHELRSTYDGSAHEIDWTGTLLAVIFPPLAICLLPCGLFPARGDNNTIRKQMVVAISGVNQRLQAGGIPVAFAFKVHLQLRAILGELTTHHVPL